MNIIMEQINPEIIVLSCANKEKVADPSEETRSSHCWDQYILIFTYRVTIQSVN